MPDMEKKDDAGAAVPRASVVPEVPMSDAGPNASIDVEVTMPDAAPNAAVGTTEAEATMPDVTITDDAASNTNVDVEVPMPDVLPDVKMDDAGVSAPKANVAEMEDLKEDDDLPPKDQGEHPKLEIKEAHLRRAEPIPPRI